MRIFLGIKFDHEVLEKIEKFLKPFKKIQSPIKWTKNENIHFTLKFIGEVTDQKYNQIETSLTGTHFDYKNLILEIRGCGKFGRGNNLGIFWLGVAPDKQLQGLYEKIEEVLAGIGIPKDDRPFKPHITVGRNKKQFNFAQIFKMQEAYHQHPIVSFRVSHIQIFQSQLTPKGPIYSILKELPVGSK